MSKKTFSPAVANFLEKNKLNKLSITLLKNDASKRIYYRFNNYKKNILLMDSSLEKKTINKFILISNWLIENNFSAPSIYIKDKAHGLLLLEDFGITKFSIILKRNKNKKLYYYKKAIDTLINLSKKKPPSFLKSYNKKTYVKELNLFLIWHLNYKDNNEGVNEWNAIWKNLLKKIDKNHTSLVLRDYHIDNIFYLAKRKKIKDIGLIDYQDALIGHPSYDLVSLLQDVRTFISQKDQKYLYNYYLSKTKYNLKEFRQTYLILGTQRLIKIIGIFKRLTLQENNKAYMKFLPRTFKLLFENLQDPIFSDLKEWMEKYRENV